ncbi:Predicted metalloprotease [Amycolatopsis arida]|uniref:Predicted metalloprotease n=1 Tax=Amycolatopsis arida TaxID=587909 RepID=A0A1I5PAP6_9PSEU|nr:neutral zinc metallopeptidase [Amycolatopsis arida]TDX98428.1 putative metalloprotease [Amycolatopsis arida]SFP31159.1 Predicted metalloprotease [Amycolatopsis arida]
MISAGRRSALVGVLAVVALAGGAACGGDTGGQPRTVGDVAGLPVTHFESGLKPDAPRPDLDVRGATDGAEDQIAVAAIADVSAYWTEHLPADFQQPFEPVETLLSYDPRSDDVEVCGTSTKDAAMNAFYCPPEDLVAWDRGMLLPLLHERFGPMAIVTVLGHEFGHAIQYRLGEKAGIDRSTKTIVKEQQADCFTGAYFRWMAEGRSPHFAVSTSEGLNQVLASLFFIRDQAGQSARDRGAHGTAFDRTYAFQLGFEKGPKDCAAIDQADVDARITEQPFHPEDKGRGDTRIDQTVIGHLKRSLDQAFARSGAQPPEIVAGAGACPNGPSTPPASYCPDTNTVTIDLAALAQLGQPVDREAEFEGQPTTGIGDFAAFAEIASRYAQGIQKGVGASLDNANAGLRTACLVGAWAGATNREGNTLRLSPGDLDEAIAELLQPRSLIAADVNGNRVANGFARVAALRTGYLEGSSPCSADYG